MHTFKFKFFDREQFYDIVRLLNNECGKGNWTIRGRVLKAIKHRENLAQNNNWYKPENSPIEKDIVVPEDRKDIEALLQLKYSR